MSAVAVLRMLQKKNSHRKDADMWRNHKSSVSSEGRGWKLRLSQETKVSLSGFQCLRWTDQAEGETWRKEEWWMLREKEINMCGGEAGWLFNYKVLPRSKRQQLQIFLTWLYNRNLGGASWQVPLWVPWEKKQLCKWLWSGLESDRKEKTEREHKKCFKKMIEWK